MARTFALSWKRLDPEPADDALARTILARAAWFAARDALPRDRLRASVGIEKEGNAAAAAFARGLARVHELGLATPTPRAGAPILHRLVAASIRGSIGSEVSEAAWVEVEQAVVTKESGINAHGDPRPLLAWQLQLRALAKAAERDGRPDAPLLLKELGDHLRIVVDLAGARAAFERALAIDERVHGPDHPNVAITVNNLRLVLRAGLSGRSQGGP
ncbi:MAG: tetratricopeptide repeat protein [Geminicoccaceae bacterium]